MIDPAVLFPALAAIVTAGFASLVTYTTMRRTKSGQINSSEADVLWKESSSIRRELREQIQQMEGHIRDNEAQIHELRRENADLKLEVMRLRTENAELRVATERLREENATLRSVQEEQHGAIVAGHAEGGTL